ncbi:hypothetical protein DPMN_160842 [Dreissena polymorpha]|uniref:Hexosyltransferase n=2 Tax=Dreissena polymorpha TaxID=45954 RepID=A0A9D4ENL6_DREPO|nr:hypothetical protein DPMN_160842 [Dreissena polymorpha]
MVTIVVSSSMYTERRQAIRNTWGANGKASNSKLFFLLGTSISGNNDIAKEFELYQDIIQVDILDRYQNLTYKSVAMLQWFNDYCSNAQVYMKADDDVYVNTDNVFTKLISLANTSRFFLCHVFRNAPPNRDLRSKWYTSETEYDKPYFPTYCSGIAYIMHGTILQDLYSSARIAKYLTMEDVFITGISARDLKVTHIHDENIWWTTAPPNGCAFQKLLVAHYMTPNDMFVVFSQLQSNEVNCTTNVNKYLKIVEDMT